MYQRKMYVFDGFTKSDSDNFKLVTDLFYVPTNPNDYWHGNIFSKTIDVDASSITTECQSCLEDYQIEIDQSAPIDDFSVLSNYGNIIDIETNKVLRFGYRDYSQNFSIKAIACKNDDNEYCIKNVITPYYTCLELNQVFDDISIVSFAYSDDQTYGDLHSCVYSKYEATNIYDIAMYDPYYNFYDDYINSENRDIVLEKTKAIKKKLMLIVVSPSGTKQINGHIILNDPPYKFSHSPCNSPSTSEPFFVYGDHSAHWISDVIDDETGESTGVKFIISHVNPDGTDIICVGSMIMDGTVPNEYKNINYLGMYISMCDGFEYVDPVNDVVEILPLDLEITNAQGTTIDNNGRFYTGGSSTAIRDNSPIVKLAVVVFFNGVLEFSSIVDIDLTYSYSTGKIFENLATNIHISDGYSDGYLNLNVEMCSSDYSYPCLNAFLTKDNNRYSVDSSYDNSIKISSFAYTAKHVHDEYYGSFKILNKMHLPDTNNNNNNIHVLFENNDYTKIDNDGLYASRPRIRRSIIVAALSIGPDGNSSRETYVNGYFEVNFRNIKPEGIPIYVTENNTQYSLYNIYDGYIFDYHTGTQSAIKFYLMRVKDSNNNDLGVYISLVDALADGVNEYIHNDNIEIFASMESSFAVL